MQEVLANSYSVFIGRNILSQLNQFLVDRQNNYSSYFILVDENTKKHCYPLIQEEVPELRQATLLEIPSGEINKNLSTCSVVWDQLLKHNADRKCLIINLGGGVIGDMGGFIASSYKRGVDFLNIPTTLLSQVDASVGGKLGIDFNGFKNVIGCFNDPIAVFADQQFLDTLPYRELRSGYAEVIKHGLIASEKYFLEMTAQKDWSDNNWEDVVAQSVVIKNQVVKADPFEKGWRKVLNYGHTIGHAIETYYLETKHRLFHGEAIAWGMLAESNIYFSRGKMNTSEWNTIVNYIKLVFEPQVIPSTVLDEIIDLMYNDKKNVGKTLNCSVIPSIGQCDIDVLVTPEEVKKAVESVNALLV